MTTTEQMYLKRFPVAPDELMDVVMGLIHREIRQEFHRLVDAELDGEPTSDPAVKRNLIERAVRDVADAFPINVRNRFVEQLDMIVDDLMGGSPVASA